MTMVSAMPVKTVARMVGEHDTTSAHPLGSGRALEPGGTSLKSPRFLSNRWVHLRSSRNLKAIVYLIAGKLDLELPA